MTTRLLAEFYRHGMHSLDPYWSPDVEAMVDPLTNHDTRETVRRFARLLREELGGDRTQTKPERQTR